MRALGLLLLCLVLLAAMQVSYFEHTRFRAYTGLMYNQQRLNTVQS